MDGSSVLKNPYFKISLFIVTAYFLFSGLYYIQGILIPILFAGLLAMLVLPLCTWLEKRGVNRGVAILLCVLLLIVVIGGLITLFTTQIAALTRDFLRRYFEPYSLPGSPHWGHTSYLSCLGV